MCDAGRTQGPVYVGGASRCRVVCGVEPRRQAYYHVQQRSQDQSVGHQDGNVSQDTEQAHIERDGLRLDARWSAVCLGELGSENVSLGTYCCLETLLSGALMCRIWRGISFDRGTDRASPMLRSRATENASLRSITTRKFSSMRSTGALKKRMFSFC